MNFERNLKDFTRVLSSRGRPLSLHAEGNEGKQGGRRRRERGRRAESGEKVSSEERGGLKGEHRTRR